MLSSFLFLFQIISYDSPRGGVSVITEKGEETASFLVIQHARPSDSGTYSCTPSLGQTVSVTVHVLRGKLIIINVMFRKTLFSSWPSRGHKPDILSGWAELDEETPSSVAKVWAPYSGNAADICLPYNLASYFAWFAIPHRKSLLK